MALGLLGMWQEAAAQAVIEGVIATTDGKPIPGAVAEISALKRNALADSVGRFRIVNVPLGQHRIQGKHLGHHPAAIDVQLSRPDTLKVVLRLQIVAQTLDGISVQGAMAEAYNSRMTGFDARRMFGNGKFLGPLDLQERRERSVESVFRELNVNVQLTPCGGETNFRPCGRPFAQGRRGPTSLRQEVCPIQVFVDGVPMPNRPVPFDLRPIKIADLAGIESYAGGSQTPLAFESGDAMCGVIAFWTRTRQP